MSRKPLTVGLLGGSFNPAHAGHLHISLEALKRLQLDEVWWLVSPQNPLKPKKNMAGYEERFASALHITKPHSRIKVSDFEKKHHLQYTFATLSEMVKRHKHINFVWIMGADNLAHFHKWQRWRCIVNIMPIVVFDRSPFSNSSLRSRAAISMRHTRVSERAITHIAGKKGYWGYMFILSRRHPASSTQIRGEDSVKSIRV